MNRGFPLLVSEHASATMPWERWAFGASLAVPTFERPLPLLLREVRVRWSWLRGALVMSQSLPSVREYLRRDTRPSHQQPDRWRLQVRVGKRAIAKLERRIAQLERELAEVGASVPPPLEPLPPPVEVVSKVAGSFKLGDANRLARTVENPAPPREVPITDSRRPDPAAIEEKAQAAEKRHRLMALAWRRQTLIWRLLADRGLGQTWSSPYWSSSAYKSGFGI